jgi:hypothetical protein
MGPLAKQFSYIEGTSHQLARTLFNYMAAYREKLEPRQHILNRLTEIGTELFAMAATCSYALYLQKQKNGDTSPVELAEYFCAMARRRIERHFNALSDNDDRKGNAVAKDVIYGHMKWLEDGIVWVGPRD